MPVEYTNGMETTIAKNPNANRRSFFDMTKADRGTPKKRSAKKTMCFGSIVYRLPPNQYAGGFISRFSSCAVGINFFMKTLYSPRESLGM